MNKVITINLGGNAWQLEEGGYDALRAYLETAGLRLAANPDREEILADIERAIAEKFRALLGSHKTVVETREVATVLTEMGPIEADPAPPPVRAEVARLRRAGPGTHPALRAVPVAGAVRGWNNPFDFVFGRRASGAGSPGGSGTGAPPAGSPRRLYRITEDDMIAGVCSGLGAYLNIDPTLVRLAFVLTTVFFGSGILVYIILAVVVPAAVTPEEKTAAAGPSPTAQEFIRRARAGYYEAMRGFPDRQARREWKRRFKREMRANAEQWRQSWHGGWYRWTRGWTPPPPAPVVSPILGLALPLISLLHCLAMIVWFCALFSLLTTGAVFGASLPGNLPEWLTVVLLFLAYGVLVSPLKRARRACCWGMSQSHWSWSLVIFVDVLLWFVIVLGLAWFAYHHFPEVCAAVQSFPALVHQAIADLRHWWHSF